VARLTYILDTNVIVDVLKGIPTVYAQLYEAKQQDAYIYLA